MMLTLGQAAKICHVSPPTVVKWIDEELLDCHKTPLGGHRRIHIDDLRKFAANESWPLDEELIAAMLRVEGAKP